MNRNFSEHSRGEYIAELKRGLDTQLRAPAFIGMSAQFFAWKRDASQLDTMIDIVKIDNDLGLAMSVKENVLRALERMIPHVSPKDKKRIQALSAAYRL